MLGEWSEYVYSCEHNTDWGQKGVSEKPDLELWVIRSNRTWLLGTKLRSFTRAICSLSPWATCPAPFLIILIYMQLLIVLMLPFRSALFLAILLFKFSFLLKQLFQSPPLRNEVSQCNHQSSPWLTSKHRVRNCILYSFLFCKVGIRILGWGIEKCLISRLWTLGLTCSTKKEEKKYIVIWEE